MPDTCVVKKIAVRTSRVNACVPPVFKSMLKRKGSITVLIFSSNLPGNHLSFHNPGNRTLY